MTNEELKEALFGHIHILFRKESLNDIRERTSNSGQKSASSTDKIPEECQTPQHQHVETREAEQKTW